MTQVPRTSSVRPQFGGHEAFEAEDGSLPRGSGRLVVLLAAGDHASARISVNLAPAALLEVQAGRVADVTWWKSAARTRHPHRGY